MPGRGWLVVGVVALLASLGYAWTALPDGPVPTHWGAGDAPDGWQDRDAFILTFLAIGLGTAAVLFAFAWYFSRSTTLAGLNVPHREFWARPENLAEGRRKAVLTMNEITGMTLLLLAVVPPGIVAATRDPGHELPWWVMAAVGVFLGATLVWVVFIFRRFDLPPRA